MNERQAVTELAGVLHAHGRRAARHELSPHRDDFATVTSINPVEITLHHGGDALPEDVLYFDANCPPQALEEGDVVVVIVIDNEHYVAGRGVMGKGGRDQVTSIDTTGLVSAAAFDALSDAVEALDDAVTALDVRVTALEAASGGARIVAGNPPSITSQTGHIASVARVGAGAGITRVTFDFNGTVYAAATVIDNSAATPSSSQTATTPAAVDIFTWSSAGAALDRTFDLLWRR